MYVKFEHRCVLCIPGILSLYFLKKMEKWTREKGNEEGHGEGGCIGDEING